MAKNTNKRIPVKWIRDGAKSAYEKQDTCFICGSEVDLELHHTHSITLLLERWTEERGIALETDEDVLEIRDQFIDEHHEEIYKAVYTLCNHHHVKLHSVYGKAPPLSTAKLQGEWIEKQKLKGTGGGSEKITTGSFTEFYWGTLWSGMIHELGLRKTIQHNI